MYYNRFYNKQKIIFLKKIMMKRNLFMMTLLCVIAYTTGAQTEKNDNPLLAEWNTPYQTPPFDQIKMEHYGPAIKKAIEMAKEEIYYITAIKTLPTFENTIVALDRAGGMVTRISSVFFNLLSAHTSPEMQQIAQEISPMLTEYGNDVSLNPALFARVKAVHDNPGKLTLEQQMLLDKTYKSFVRNGANLSEQDKETYRKLSMQLSTLTLNFSKNVLDYTNSWHKVLHTEAELKGIPETELALAQQKAKAKDKDGYLFDLSQPSYLTIMKYAEDRELRKEFFIKYNSRAYHGEFDNSKNIKEILICRYEMAKLLGFENYAEYALAERMAENSKNVYQLLDQLREYSLPAGKREIASLTEYAKRNGLNEELQRWDFTFYSEKQKNELFNLNDEILKPYFKLENAINGVFDLVSELFNLTFVTNDKIPVYHKDVTTYEVYREGKFLAVLYLDFHPRDSKRGGAWMTSFREQHFDTKGNDVRPLVSLVMNFTPSTPEQPSLLTFDEVTTFLHEFGHALHGMLSEVTYESLSGTSVPRDFVELPSHIFENWATEQNFLNKFAKHYLTGEVIPVELVKKLHDYNNYLAGYASCRQLSFGYLDMMWHTMNPASIEVENILKIERMEMNKLELLPVVPDACMSTSFSHIFAGGYAAGYYGYKWAEVLDADAFSLFQEKGIFNKEIAKKFADAILSKGGTDKPMNLYIDFRGRKPDIEALLIRSGLKK